MNKFNRFFGHISKMGPLSGLRFINPNVGVSGNCNNIRLARLLTQLVQSIEFASAQRYYATKSDNNTVKNFTSSLKDKEKLEREKKKKAEPPKIVLITETNAIVIVTLEEAGKLAKKKGLNLIEVEDSKKEGLKTDKQVYKLVSNAKYYGEDWKGFKGGEGKTKDSKEKEEKTVMLNCKTSEHDVLTKIKSIKKWVEKGHVVKIMIGQAGQQGQNPEIVYKIIENQIKDEPLRIIQKITKNSQIRFHIMPPKKEKIAAVDESKSKKDQPKVTAAANADADDDDESAKVASNPGKAPTPLP